MVNIESVRSGSDKVFSALVFLMATVFFISSFSLPASSALLPRGVAFLTAVLDVPVMIKIWRTPVVFSEEKVALPVYTSILLLIIYYFALSLVGYIVATFVYIVVVGRLVGLKRWVGLVVLAIILVASTSYIFGVTFAVQLPTGLLF